ncbi:probable 28S ribosomal protein S26, mitochondrial [Centruroides sculpturatus]|uniref:probable 28S ribosomal protein S26, mitochondrial n=1 Tax=Centruroides sculpturatus TaxID=218467 RepID=UPI000C6CDC8E|nr:probable 28S ribosomal protein S26, mitochondrial [Centruroides sculpturatus]
MAMWCASKALSNGGLVRIPLLVVQRWRRKSPARKPRWLPMAPSKLFRINNPPDIPKEEFEQIFTLYHVYKCNMRSIQNFLHEEHKKATQVGEEVVERAKQEELEHQRLMEENRLENERMLKLRNERLEKNLQKEIDDLLQIELDVEQQKLEEKEEAEKLVLREMELSKSFIREDTLDEAIAQALDNPVNYNFAIDLKGNIYWEDEKIIPSNVKIYVDKSEEEIY